MNNKEKYKQWCDNNKDLPLFYRHGYYQALFGNNWDVALDIRDEKIVGCLPYIIRSKFGFKKINPELFLPYQGVWINYPQNQKYATKIGFEKEVCEKLLKQMPDVAFYHQMFHPNFTNWMAFYWKGFEQTTRYTYIINYNPNIDAIFDAFKSNLKWDIRKAEKSISISTSENIEQLYKLKKQDYNIKNIPLNVPFEKVNKLYEYCKSNNCGELLTATDDKANIHAMMLLVWDEHTAYYLFSATNHTFKTSGAMSLLIWEAIKKMNGLGKNFNFEGSMIKSIEKHFRGFGGIQTPYFSIKKTNSSLFKLLNR
jgi:hypothetical protein